MCDQGGPCSLHAADITPASHFLNKGKRPTLTEVSRVLQTQASLSEEMTRRDFRFPLIRPVWNSDRANHDSYSMLSFIAMPVDTEGHRDARD